MKLNEKPLENGDFEEEWYTLEDIVETDNDDTLYCIEVDSEDHQFLVGEIKVNSCNTEAGKEQDALKGEASMIIGSIARLGRAAGVHLVIATQRPDAKILAGETKALEVSTPVLTDSGWKTMGDLVPHQDKVFTPDGRAQRIVDATDVFEEECFEITFGSGNQSETIVAGRTHKWPVWMASRRNSSYQVKSHAERYPEHKDLLERLRRNSGVLNTDDLFSVSQVEEILYDDVSDRMDRRVHVLRRFVNEGRINPVDMVESQGGRFGYSLYRGCDIYGSLCAYLDSEFSSVNDAPEVVSTEEIYRRFLESGEKRYMTKMSVSTARPLQLDDKVFEIPPYVLGLWLGDGYSDGSAIACGAIEDLKSYKSYVERNYPAWVEVFPLEIVPVKVSEDRKPFGVLKSTDWRKTIKNLDLLGNKHVPREYLLGSESQRRELLAGLLDTDGTGMRKQVKFTNTNKNLVDAVAFLARSLGYKVGVSHSEAVLDDETGDVRHKEFWNVVFTVNEPLFNLERKNAALELDGSDRVTQDRHYITDIKPVGSRKVRCIQVSDENHEYLAGRTLIPTHNSNLHVRINCGRTNPTASSMILENSEGTRVKSNPRGRVYLKIHGSGDHGQGFFAPQSWIDEWLESKGLNPDGSPVGSNKQSKLAHLVDMSEFEDGDLDSRSGIDNSAIIDQIRQEEASDIEEDSWGFDDSDGSDFSDDNDGYNDSLPEDSMGRPQFGESKDRSDQFYRPEDDWSQDLEDLIEENNS